MQHLSDSTRQITNPVVHEITTTSQKIYKVFEDKKSAGLSDITIVAQGFKSSEDVFEIKDCDPLKDHFILDLNNDGYPDFVRNTAFDGIEVYLQHPATQVFGDGLGGTTPQYYNDTFANNVADGTNTEGLGILEPRFERMLAIAYEIENNHRTGKPCSRHCRDTRPLYQKTR